MDSSRKWKSLSKVNKEADLRFLFTLLAYFWVYTAKYLLLQKLSGPFSSVIRVWRNKTVLWSNKEMCVIFHSLDMFRRHKSYKTFLGIVICNVSYGLYSSSCPSLENSLQVHILNSDLKLSQRYFSPVSTLIWKQPPSVVSFVHTSCCTSKALSKKCSGKPDNSPMWRAKEASACWTLTEMQSLKQCCVLLAFLKVICIFSVSFSSFLCIKLLVKYPLVTPEASKLAVAPRG